MIDYTIQLERLLETSDEIGLVQHSKESKPDLNFGYSIDDVARGLVVLSRTYPEFDDKGLHNIYLNYIKNARRDDGFFHNFYERKDKEWVWRKEEAKSLQDCYGRVVWALSEFINSKYPIEEKKEAEELLLRNILNVVQLSYNASRSFALLGMSEFYSNLDKSTKVNNPIFFEINFLLSKKLKEKFDKHSDDNWKWFSDEMNYCNPKIPNSMLKAGKILEREDMFNIGKSSLDFLISKSFDNNNNGIFHAIGNKGWYKKGEEYLTLYDQQTVEAGDMVEACVEAYEYTGEKNYLEYAKKAFNWFNGENVAKKSMLDEKSRGVYDAITENGLNTNQGAESLLSYLLAATKLRNYY